MSNNYKNSEVKKTFVFENISMKAMNVMRYILILKKIFIVYIYWKTFQFSQHFKISIEFKNNILRTLTETTVNE